MRLWAVILASVAVLVVIVSFTVALLTTEEFGPLPDKAAALKAGCSVLYQERFGLNVPIDCKTLQARLEGDVWILTGPDLPKGVVGGGPVIELSKTDGRIIRFYQTAG
jgi:hypothetical protein